MKWTLGVAIWLAFLPVANGQSQPRAEDGQPRPRQISALANAAPALAAHSSAYWSAQRKLKEITDNGRLTPAPAKTTVLSAEEINAYLAEGGVTLPDGVQRVHFSSVPGTVTATARIDFDRLTATRKINNPLMAALFTGVHEVSVETRVSGSGGLGRTSVQSVAIDGVNVPRMAMQFLIDYYVRPKYGPNIGLDSRFPLPAHIDAVTVGDNQVTVTQK